MTITNELNERMEAAADYIGEHGWTQGIMKTADGKVCLTGAVMYCRPQVGDEQIIVQVLRYRKRAEQWNDEDGRTAIDVIEVLHKDISDGELAETFGPQWEQIIALVRRAAEITAGDAEKLDAAWDAARDAAWDAAWDAARVAAWDAAWVAARDAARVAAWALSTRDLIGQNGFTQEHYDTLTGPWRKVIGPIHPDDEEM